MRIHYNSDNQERHKCRICGALIYGGSDVMIDEYLDEGIVTRGYSHEKCHYDREEKKKWEDSGSTTG